MDPFGTAGAAVGLIDVCVRVAFYVRQVRKDGASLQQDLLDLGHEIEDLQELCRTLTIIVGPVLPSSLAPLPDTKETTAHAGLWNRVYVTLGQCRDTLGGMQAILADLYGERPDDESLRHRIPRQFDTLMKVHRKRSREPDLQAARKKLKGYMSALQLLFGAISRQDAKFAQLVTTQSFEGLFAIHKETLSEIGDIKGLIGTANHPRDETRAALDELNELEISITSAFSAIAAETENIHFDIPQSVSSCYVGREDLLLELRNSLSTQSAWTHDHQQWRFVVQGIGGSGKTQFCSKFAWENRHSFWGVFTCNASSETTLQQTMGEIAQYAKLAADSDTAIQWLSDVKKRWLLIIDNADDERIDLSKYFPNNSRGHILISTRVPAFQRYGTIDPAYYDFTSRALSEEEATNLLLRESLKSPPKEISWKSLASKITKSLGYLALAICHAGAAIRSGLCDLSDFLEFYDASWKSVRNSSGVSTDPEKQHEVCAMATWEMLYQQLQARNTQAVRDAVELLKIFAFLHWENVPRELLTRAMLNSQLEAEQGQKDQAEEALSSAWKHQSWSEWFSSKQLAMLLFVASQAPSPFPGIIQHGRKPANFDDAEMRVRHAIKELTQRSLIMQNTSTRSDTTQTSYKAQTSYTMHTIVHRWARMRPQMGLQEQSRWADAAGRILSASILIPPLGMKTSDETYHLSLLSHVEHVQDCRKAIAEEMKTARNLNLLSWMGLSRITGGDKLLMLGKFSVVYSQSGRYDKAEELLVVVNDALCRLLGAHHPRARRIAILLSMVYWKQSKATKASSLQSKMLQDCEQHYGHDHPETLRAMRDLGNSLWQLGRYSDALELQRKAVKGLETRLGHDHPDTLKAVDQLGLTVVKFYRRTDIEEAHDLHDTAVEGMQKIHGKDHHRTLDAKQNLSRVLLLRSTDDFALAEKLMQEVLKTNERKLGESAPETLIAMINMAITKCAVGRPREGEEIIRKAYDIGERLFGGKHIAVLWGKSILAITLTHQKRFKEAEDILKSVSQVQIYMAARRGDYHPDRIATLIELARCYHLQGKIQKSLETCNLALKGLEEISRPGSVHAFTQQIRPVRDMLAKCLEAESRDLLGDEEVAAPPRIAFPSIHFLDSHLWEHTGEGRLMTLAE